jgi:hypothetical protein
MPHDLSAVIKLRNRMEIALRNFVYVVCILIMCITTIIMYGASEMTRAVSKFSMLVSDKTRALATHCKDYLDAMVSEYRNGETVK